MSHSARAGRVIMMGWIVNHAIVTTSGSPCINGGRGDSVTVGRVMRFMVTEMRLVVAMMRLDIVVFVVFGIPLTRPLRSRFRVMESSWRGLG